MSLINKLDRHAELVGRMSSTLGVDLVEAAQRGQVSPDVARTAVLTCLGCQRGEACESWLDDHADGAKATPGYCRNQSLLNSLAR